MFTWPHECRYSWMERMVNPLVLGLQMVLGCLLWVVVNRPSVRTVSTLNTQDSF